MVLTLTNEDRGALKAEPGLESVSLTPKPCLYRVKLPLLSK